MGEVMIVRTRSEWLDQMRDASDPMNRMENELGRPVTLMEFADYDYENFCLLIEAMYALGVNISKEVMDRAKMVTVNEALGIPYGDERDF